MSGNSIPISCTRRSRRDPVAGEQAWLPRVLLTGAAGVMATALARNLAADHTLVAVDVNPVREPEYWTEVHKVTVGDRDTLATLLADVDLAIHLAHGAYAGWEGLREVDIDGTRNVLDGALAGTCRRVVLVSTNHVSGWTELDYLAGVPAQLPVQPTDPPRPDGLYSVAKVAMEALGRAAAESCGLPVSVLRVGTFRLSDDFDAAVQEPDFEYIGDHAAVHRRLERTWLSHVDLFRIVREEFAAAETFRLRYATSDQDGAVWSSAPTTWSSPSTSD